MYGRNLDYDRCGVNSCHSWIISKADVGILVLQILFFLLQKIGVDVSWDEFSKLFN